MRLAAYTGTSMVLATGVIIQALHQRTNFYSACVYLAQSNACLMILTNLVLVCLCAVVLGLQRLLYGPLRPIEIEQLYEKAWFAITETCLAMTIFREEVGGWFLVMFVSLLIGKVWGWIGEGRVDILEQQPPVNPRLFHARLSFSLFLSLVYGAFMLDYSVTTVLRQARPNMMVMFAFEFAVLTITSLSTAARYAISLREAYIIKLRTREQVEERRAELRGAREEAFRQAAAQDNTVSAEESSGHIPDDDSVEEGDIDVPGWEDKGRWVFYLNLTTDFLKLVVYLSFFTILFMFYGLPIHIMRDVFLTLRSFFKRIADFLRYRNATRDMNERYPDATAEDIGREDVCIICREEMRPWQQPNNDRRVEEQGLRPARRLARTLDERLRPKKLPCGHVLHFGCLRSWLERQQICPTCRRPVVVTNRLRVVPANAPAVNNMNHPLAGQAHQFQPPQPQADPHGQAGQEQAPGGLNRARVFNLGPLRIALGQARGDVFQNQAHLANQGLAGQPGANLAAPQEYGFTFGFQRHQADPRNSATQGNPAGVQSQLHQIEQQIMQGINGLRVSAEQLTMVRALQGELARLRIAQANPGIGQGVVPHVGNPAGYGSRPTHPPAQIVQATPAMQAYSPTGQLPAMSAGRQDLPPGLTLPEGWTLLPLHRIQQDIVPSQPTQTQAQQLPDYPSHHAPEPSSLSASTLDQAPSRFGEALSSSNIPRLSPASGMTGANPPDRWNRSVASQTPSTDRSIPQVQPEQTLAFSEVPQSLSGEKVSDGGRSNRAELQPDGTACQTSGRTVDAETSYGAPLLEALEVDQTPPAPTPVWGTGLQAGQETRDKTDDAPTTVRSTVSEPMGERTPTESASSGQSKGKGRAVTVEDFIDNID